MEGWVAELGGIDPAAGCQARLDRAVAVIADTCDGLPIRAAVLASDAPGAFSWPGGRVFVTRGLIELLDDQELVAAVDHELGHLLGDRSSGSIVALNGAADDQAEPRADRIGVGLLERQGLPPELMRRMLTKVSGSSALPLIYRAPLEHRIELLQPIKTAAAPPNP